MTTNFKKVILILSILLIFLFYLDFGSDNLNKTRYQYFNVKPKNNFTGKSIKIAIFDTSFINDNKNILCFSEENVELSSSCKRNCNSEYSECEHSKRIAKIIKEIAPSAEILSYNIASSLKNGKQIITQNNFKNALSDIKTKNINVLNLSFGFDDLVKYCNNNNFIINIMLQTLVDSKVVIFASTGNEYKNNFMTYPSCLSNVNSVSSLDKESIEISDFANYSKNTKFFAISKYLTDDNSDLYYGTSFATAIASGVQATLMEKKLDCNIKNSKIINLDQELEFCK